MPENKQKRLSPENIDAIVEIVKNYKLGPTDLFDPELTEILNKAESPEERIKIAKNLPFNKILYIVEKIFSGKVSIENLANLLQKDLNISSFLAEKIAREIREKIFFEKVEIPKEEGPAPTKRDIYREPIE